MSDAKRVWLDEVREEISSEDFIQLEHGIVSREFVISQTPDFIFITSIDISSEKKAKT